MLHNNKKGTRRVGTRTGKEEGCAREAKWAIYYFIRFEWGLRSLPHPEDAAAVERVDQILHRDAVDLVEAHLERRRDGMGERRSDWMGMALKER